MTRIAKDKQWMCSGCNALLWEPMLLSAPSPFDPEQTLTACPRCKQCDERFIEICDEPSCVQEAGCGWPTGDDNDAWGGYRRTCSKHADFNFGKRASIGGA